MPRIPQLSREPTRQPKGQNTRATVTPPAKVISPAADVLSNESLRSPLVQAMSAKLSPTDLANSYRAGLIDAGTRADIFRQHLLHLFPNAHQEILKVSLDPKTDYFKLLAFIQTGVWPKGSSGQLQLAYLRIVDPLLAQEGRAWRAEVYASYPSWAPAQEGQLHPLDRPIMDTWKAISHARRSGESHLELSNLIFLNRLPSHLWTLQQLVHLRLAGGEFMQLPEELGKLSRLQSLQIDNMKNLRRLPKSIADLSRLQTLSFCGNAMQTSHRLVLPRQLAELPSLQSIDVGASKMRRPDWLPAHVDFHKIVERPVSEDEDDRFSDWS